ncbi:MAG: helix-turn-helix domain-containing protein [Micropruina sp.]
MGTSDLLDQYADYHPVLSRSLLGRLELIISLPAETLWQAVHAVGALTQGLDAVAVTIESSADFDRRSDLAVPDLCSVTEAARRLGMTRAGIQRRIENGTLPAVRIGKTWATPASTLRGALREH